MAATFSAIATKTLGIEGTTVTTGSFSVGAGTTLVHQLYTRKSQGSTQATVTGGGLTWTNHDFAGGRTHIAYAHASAATSLTITSSWGVTSKAAITIPQYTGGDSATIAGSASATSTRFGTSSLTLQHTLTTATDSSLHVAAYGAADADSGITATFTHRGEVQTGGVSSAKSGIATGDHLVTTAGADSVQMGDSGINSDKVAVSIEILEAQGAAPPAASVKRMLALTGVGRVFSA